MNNKVCGLPELRCDTCEHRLANLESSSLDTILNPKVKDGDTVDFFLCYRFETTCPSCPTRHVWVYRGKHGVARKFSDYQLYTNDDVPGEGPGLWDWVKWLFHRRYG